MFDFLDIPTLLAFLSAGILLNLTPGNDVIFTIATTLRKGTKAGLLAGIGITLGSLCHVLLAALGLAVILKQNPAFYTAILWVGAAYLLLLAVQSWRAPPPNYEADEVPDYPLLRGFLTNILNPKVALFILAFLPQFTRPELGRIDLQIVALGLIFATTGLIVITAYALLAAQLRASIRSEGRFLNRLSALLFGGLAARMILN